MGSGSFLKLLAQNFDVLAGPLVALVYPLYALVQAIETKSHVDDQQWLTYWVLYALITLFELTFAKLIEWLPFWSFAKLIFICWLALPYFNGAACVYQNFIRPVFVNHQTVNVWYVPRKKGVFSKPDDFLVPRKKSVFSKPDDFLAAIDKFIEENGSEALQKLKNKVGKLSPSSKPKKSNERAVFPEAENAKSSKPKKSNEGALFPEAEKSSKPKKSNKHVLFPGVESNKPLKPKKKNKHVTFAEVEEHEKESFKSDRHTTHDATVGTEPENSLWANSNFMIFDNENGYWNH